MDLMPTAAPADRMENVPAASTAIAAQEPVVLKEAARVQMATHIAMENDPMASTVIAAHAQAVLLEAARVQMVTRIVTENAPTANMVIAAHVQVVLQEAARVPMVRPNTVRAQTLRALTPLPHGRESRSCRTNTTADWQNP
jgi:hypothetical protein